VETLDFELNFEQSALADSLRAFVERELYPHEDEVERRGEVPQEIAAEIRQKALAGGFNAMNMPAEMGGGGLDNLTLALASRELGRPSTALSVLLNQPARILLACKDAQVERYLLPTIRGERLECFALTEPGAGSDARGITTRALRDGDDYVINGTKQFISHADLADFIILFAVTGTEQGPRGERKRFTAFLVDKDSPGVTVTRMPCISTRGYNPNMVYLEEVRVPAANILGEEGKGFDFANDWLYAGRVMLSASCVGRGHRVLEMTAKWASERRAFGRPIGEFQGVSFQLADMATEIHLTEIGVLQAAWKMDRDQLTRMEASMINLFASEMIGRVTDKAVQIFGGMGLMEEFPIQRFWRDARIERIWEGTSEIQRHVISRDLLKAHGA
jgi:acyl-CoA dehydrogenase